MGGIMDIRYAIALFVYRDWEPLTVKGEKITFESENLAEEFVRSHPHVGGEQNRAICKGDWRIVEDNEYF
jgi:hypothetical protein